MDELQRLPTEATALDLTELEAAQARAATAERQATEARRRNGSWRHGGAGRASFPELAGTPMTLLPDPTHAAGLWRPIGNQGRA